ncbi:FHA domain-containing protein [Paenarthrobacter nicotinovorans]|uniref:FHA domain-containing protein n=1 Tax=Paenarthrobacter nicotinovorans TaxID=29320 RepID=UPI00381F6528
MELMIVVGMVLFTVLGALGMLYQRLYIRYGLYRPREVVASLMARRRLGGGSDYELIVLRIQHAMRQASIRNAQGRRLAVSALTLWLNDSDLGEITNFWKLEDFVRDIAEAYRTTSTEGRWGNIPSTYMDIYIVVEPGCRDNRPRLRPGRPPQGGTRIQVLLDQPVFSVEKSLVPELAGTDTESGDAGISSTTAFDSETVPFTDAELHEAVHHWKVSPSGDDAAEETSPAPVEGRLRSGGQLVCILTASGVTIGRAATCDLVLQHKSISRRHARIYKDSAAWYLSPIESHRCSINDQPVYEDTPIKEGDVLQFGGAAVSYTFESGHQ